MPSSLALARAGRAITMTVPQYRYARMAARYGPAAARAGGRIARWAYRRYRKRRSGYRRAKKARFSNKNVGEALGSSSTKPNLQFRTSTAITRDTRTLYTLNLCNCDQGPNRNNRERNIINVRGFKICFSMRNNLDEPLYLNVAILHPKNAGDITPANFFRAHGTSRGSDFDLTKTALEFHCLSLNTDKFAILKHKRYRLRARGGTAYSDGTGRNYINLDWYIKLKRQLRYDASTSEAPIDGSCYLVYWMDRFFGAQNEVVSTNACNFQERHIMYFRDTKC